MNKKTIGKKYIVGDEQLGFVCDSFGAKILAFYKAGKNCLFYTEDDVAHSGIPLCFPSFGPLDNDQFLWQGETYEMKQHGFVRDSDFEFLSQNETSLSLVLRSLQSSEARFPFDFEFEVSYSLVNGELLMDYNFKNLAEEALPLAPGIHPYFAVDEPSEIIFSSNARSVNDNHQNYALIDMAEVECFEPVGEQRYRIHGAPDLHISGHTQSSNLLSMGSQKIEMTSDPSRFKRYTIWRKNADVNYICFEPANEKNALNANPQMIEQGDSWQARVVLK